MYISDNTLIELVTKDYGITKKQAKDFIKQHDKELLKKVYHEQCKKRFIMIKGGYKNEKYHYNL